MILDELMKRYSVKAFDKTKKVSQEDIETLKKVLQYSPSSTNLQPWGFVIASTDEGKKKIAKATEGFYSFNEHKVLNASHVFIFTTRADLSQDYLEKVLEKEVTDGRYPNDDIKQDNHKAREMSANHHRDELGDLTSWLEKQTYLNAGFFLAYLAHMGIGSVPIEGFDSQILDEQLGLKAKGFTSTLIIPVGYHSDEDYNAKTPKSRLDIKDIIEEI